VVIGSGTYGTPFIQDVAIASSTALLSLLLKMIRREL
jgi:hypothetical protein